ncbi:MAG TPA: type II toxin-antitoxin system PemK/MazF family toxin [Acidimicrobiales bacterium]|nr:type II toxin-antitoxin system PemK/MazF family toxin [Acidimicrobiales bacterium]
MGKPFGHEPAFVRPAVVVSSDVVNQSVGDLVLIVPIGSASYGLRSHVELEPGLSGLDHVSYARADQVRVVSTRRLSRCRGILPPDALYALDRAMRFVLDL